VTLRRGRHHKHGKRESRRVRGQRTDRLAWNPWRRHLAIHTLIQPRASGFWRLLPAQAESETGLRVLR
jgi:hypothetical protein